MEEGAHDCGVKEEKTSRQVHVSSSTQLWLSSLALRAEKMSAWINTITLATDRLLTELEQKKQH